MIDADLTYLTAQARSRWHHGHHMMNPSEKKKKVVCIELSLGTHHTCSAPAAAAATLLVLTDLDFLPTLGPAPASLWVSSFLFVFLLVSSPS